MKKIMQNSINEINNLMVKFKVLNKIKWINNIIIINLVCLKIIFKKMCFCQI